MNSQKTEYIKSRYIKDRLEEMNKDEIEFYEQEAEMYTSSLKEQNKDSEQEQPKDIVILAIETARKVKSFVIDVEDLDYKLQKLYRLKEALKDNLTLEITDTFLQMLEREIQETKEGIQVSSFEVCQIVGG